MTDLEPVLNADEVAVLRLLAAGNTHRETGVVLNVSERTVKRRSRDAATVLGTTNTTHTVAEALRRGLLDEE